MSSLTEVRGGGLTSCAVLENTPCTTIPHPAARWAQCCTARSEPLAMFVPTFLISSRTAGSRFSAAQRVMCSRISFSIAGGFHLASCRLHHAANVHAPLAAVTGLLQGLTSQPSGLIYCTALVLSLEAESK